MKNKNKIILLMTLLFMILSTQNVYAAEIEKTQQITGAVTLLPPLVAIILAFITKNVVVSLFI